MMSGLRIIFLLSIFIPISFRSYSQIISTYAGVPTVMSYGGDGGLATSAKFIQPVSIAIDNFNNLYIADYSNHIIRKVNYTTGIITTVAGTPTVSGFSGDGGLATAAKLNNPYAVAIDNSGNILIADRDNNRIRKINVSTGLITTIAGTGVNGYSGDGGQAILADIRYPHYITVDGTGNIYFTQMFDNVVRKINGSTGIITTIVGTGSAGFSGDGGLATMAQLDRPFDLVTDNNNLYIADYGNHRIRKVNFSSGIISTIAGTGNTSFSGDGGLAINANLYYPWGLGIDFYGNIYIAGTFHQRVRKINASSGIISTIAGSCTVSCIPYGAYSGDGGPATLAELNVPVDVCFDGLGNMYIADSENACIRKVPNTVSNGINENNLFTDHIGIYPQPAKDILYINLSDYYETTVQMRITDVSGREILNKELPISNYKASLSTEDLSDGVYILQIVSKNQVVQKRLIIAK